VWALIESHTVPGQKEETRKLAIIGAGFAGLTLAAGLLQKRAALDITIFEARDTLLPLQQGSDSRWLHPQIYNWPAKGSEAVAAMLPVLNWTAGRASDVVVQALTEWQRLVGEEETNTENLRLFCNTRHLQIDRYHEVSENGDSTKVKIEWVGEPRVPGDGTTKSEEVAVGRSESFDFAIMTVGFGLERETMSSYWRNETFGQPSLGQPRGTYLVSGQGDGAMIDLLRLRISQYRQDRILDELFAGKDELLSELKGLQKEVSNDLAGRNLFQRFECLGEANQQVRADLESLLQKLRHRLRRDTEVILHLKVRSLEDLLTAQVGSISFQNALLAYLVYKCGGFAPTNEQEKVLTGRMAIPAQHIVRRHGTNRLRQFERLLSEELYEELKKFGESDFAELRQGAEIRWKGGYFGIPGRLSDRGDVSDKERATWRKEYLPGPTAILATVLCGSIAGGLARLRPQADHFRVTVHRVINIHNDDLLQQMCDYMGRVQEPKGSMAGRTFPMNATIGMAYKSRRIVRSIREVDRDVLQDSMKKLELQDASRKMAQEVSCVLAIPIVQPADAFYGTSPVAGVVYIDSRVPDFWLSDEEVLELCNLTKYALKGIQDGTIRIFDRIRNIPMSDISVNASPGEALPASVDSALELLSKVSPPHTERAFQFNFEHSDLTAVPLAPDVSISSSQETPHV
jgi:hypothetical protein